MQEKSGSESVDGTNTHVLQSTCLKRFRLQHNTRPPKEGEKFEVNCFTWDSDQDCAFKFLTDMSICIRESVKRDGYVDARFLPPSCTWAPSTFLLLLLCRLAFS